LVTKSSYPRYSKEEFARRGDEIYERDILPRMRSEDDRKVVAIEIETGDYEIGKDEIDAAHRLRTRHPVAPFWFRRVGSSYLHRFGHRPITAA
jgi:hypothetical protein